ncbi:hypothetical protein GOBAR_AA35863 [Gossypium barbadense]|uniref:Uncharacterized protein n=1 Tax=Gossypium barbadense TaxID=3634 RepID=A0A2P5W183_GOSBA|nr:hypothetical protein GOBAR_AA35863 [Gossypium barbadense]
MQLALKIRKDSLHLNQNYSKTIRQTKDEKSQSSLEELPRTKTTETVRNYHEENKDVHEERRLQIEELDEWREHKPRTHDKPKLRKNKPDTSPNQLQVGDIVLLDAVDPHIVTTTPNEEIPFMVLSISPFGIMEVSHPKFGTFKVNNTGLKHYFKIENRNEEYELLKSPLSFNGESINSIFSFLVHTARNTGMPKPWPNRGRDTAVRYKRVEAGHDFPKTWGAINPHGRATWPWVNYIGTHGHGNENPRTCQGQGSILFLRHRHATCPCHLVAYNNTRACYHITGVHYVVIKRKEGCGPILKETKGIGFFLGRCIDWAAVEQVQLTDVICALLSTDLWEQFFAITKPTYLELTLELCSNFHLQVVMTNNDDPSTIHFRLDGLFRLMSVPEFGVSLGLYTDKFMEEEDMNALPRNIHISPSFRSKASALLPSLLYLHAILAHTLTGRRESTDVLTTHDAYYLWCMANAYMTDLAYFIAFAIHHQIELHRKGVISIGPYVTHLARHFSLLNTAAQSSALTLIGQMSPQGITTMLHMRMIER